MSDPLIVYQAVSVGYGGDPILSDIAFQLHRGDFLAFVGPNGSGKTTLLRTIAGVLPPIHGHVSRRSVGAIGYVPQERDLDPVFPLSAAEVVLQGRTARVGPWRRPGAVDREVVRRAMAETGVAALSGSPFHGLSGGQKQRVLIARALAVEPALMVLDEPTTGMDPAAERAVMDLLLQLHREHGLAIVVATHNLSLVGNYAKRIALVDRERRLFQLGTDEEILADETLTRLYGCGMKVRRVEGWRTVIPGGAHA
ncbi:MAG: metal ABC transporter ATP-binding protein [Candidatus Rokubacteria bacterium]|nr:metal ABC transporter ATP-binding protein [Candidatus Rokubacteria bacterium]